MQEVNLTIDDFHKYFGQRKLGRLSFPNRNCRDLSGTNVFGRKSYKKIDFYIELYSMYRLTFGWQIKSSEFEPQDIIAIIVFGSAVEYPGWTPRIIKRKKYYIFGEETEEEVGKNWIKPNDADFFVLTREEINKEEFWGAKIKEFEDDYGGFSYIMKGGIHLIYGGVNQLLRGVEDNNTVSVSVMKKGISIFFNEEYNSIVEKTDLKKETPRKVSWDEDKEGFLFGQIE